MSIRSISCAIAAMFFASLLLASVRATTVRAYGVERDVGAGLLRGSETGYVPVAVEDRGVVTHLHDASLIAHDIDAAHNAYVHKDCFITWKGEGGAAVYENSTDCSDFLNLVLAHSYKVSTADLHKLTGHDRPTATVWYDTIVAGKGFDVVPTLKQVRPGDIIAVQYPPGGEDTGHIMIIAGEPVARRASVPVEKGTEQWEVPVIDSSKSGHGTKDTRHHADGSFDRGVGQGILRVYTNADGTVAGYSWSVLSASTFQASGVHKIVIGRLQVKGLHVAQ